MRPPLTLAPRRAPTGRRHGEEGSTFLIALLFVVVVGLLTYSLLGFSKVGNAATRSYEMERTRRYAVDSAMQSAIEMVRVNTNMGVTTSPDECVLEHTVIGKPKVIYPGTYLVVKCEATSLASITSGGTDSDGGQAPRDVTFRVLCYNDPVNNPTRLGLLTCASGNDEVELARARVRYEIDYSSDVPAAERAIIPKVITWEMRAEP